MNLSEYMWLPIEERTAHCDQSLLLDAATLRVSFSEEPDTPCRPWRPRTGQPPKSLLLDFLGVVDDVDDWHRAGIHRCHICQNDSTTVWCVEPSHLFLGWASENRQMSFDATAFRAGVDVPRQSLWSPTPEEILDAGDFEPLRVYSPSASQPLTPSQTLVYQLMRYILSARPAELVTTVLRASDVLAVADRVLGPNVVSQRVVNNALVHLVDRGLIERRSIAGDVGFVTLYSYNFPGETDCAGTILGDSVYS